MNNKEKLDILFSHYVKLRERICEGMVRCYTCGKPVRIENSECGHFIPRQYLSVRYSEINCHVQCFECNREKRGNVEVYEQKLREQYGDEVINDLLRSKNTYTKFTESDYKDKIKVVRDEIKRLEL